MLANKKAQAVIRNNIKKQGKPFTFIRYIVDKYGQNTNKYDAFKINALYHEQTTYVTRTIQDSGTTRVKKQPMLLYDVSQVTEKPKYSDIFLINEKEFKVIKVTNLFELNLFYDISLEKVE